MDALSLEARCYHFASQNVFLSNIGPSHFGVAGPDRIFLVFELAGKLEIYKFIPEQSQQFNHCEYDENGEEIEKEHVEEKNQKDEFVLERSIQIQDVDIVQVVHCQIIPEYFVFMINNRLTRLRSVRAYTNYMIDTKPELLFKIKLRLNGELIRTLTSQTDDEVPSHLANVDTALNIIEFQHTDIGALANYIHCCPVLGNLVISIANGTTLLYRYTRCILPSNKCHVAIDFILIKTITVLGECWIPQMVKLSLNYVALMSQSHFSLIQIEFTDDESEYENGHHRLEYKYDPKFRSSDECHLIYNRLFDEFIPQDNIFGIGKNRQQSHADTVWGPVSDELSCKFAVYDQHNAQTKASSYQLLLCRMLSLPKQKRTKSNSTSDPKFFPNNLTTLRAKNSICTDQMTNSLSDSKLYLFGFDLLPYRDRYGVIFAHALYLLWANQLTCYLIDLRRDKLKLVPISQLNLTETSPTSHSIVDSHLSNVLIRDFSASPQEDLVHVLTDGSFDTYSTQFFPFLVSQEPQNMYNSRPLAELYQISSHIFFNVIASLSSPEFVFLVSAEESGRHTIYNLHRPSVDHLQADILSKIDDIKSESETPHNKHSLHRMYIQLLSFTKFISLFPTRSLSFGGSDSSGSGSRLQRLEQFYTKIHAEMEDIIRQRPLCNYPKCSFVIANTVTDKQE